MSDIRDCPFCFQANMFEDGTDPDNVIWKGKFCYVKYDGYPVTPYHALIIPYAHVSDYFALSERERQEMDKALFWTSTYIESLDSSVTSFNMGINNGESAGQTIPHCHIHMIPRRDGDMADPKGGVRGVIPEKQKY